MSSTPATNKAMNGQRPTFRIAGPRGAAGFRDFQTTVGEGWWCLTPCTRFSGERPI